MKKAGDMRKRRLLAFSLGVSIVFAKIEVGDHVYAQSNKSPLEIRMEVTEEQKKVHFVSTMQTEVLLAKLEEQIKIAEENWMLLHSGECTEISRIKLEIEMQISECEKLQEEVGDTKFVERIWYLRESFEAMESFRKKMAGFNITEYMDMSTVIGLSQQEIRYVLLNIRKDTGEYLCTNYQLADELSGAIVEGANIYQVNELFIISVLIWETAWITNQNAQNNNWGSLRHSAEEGFLCYDTVEEGMLATVSAIRYNMVGNNTSDEISRGYCRMSPEENQRWATSKIQLMRKCSRVGGE